MRDTGRPAHAVALREERDIFEFTDMSQLNPSSAPLDQLGFRGAHSDIGGGYGAQTLTAVTLDWMNQEAKKAGWTTLDTTKPTINKTVEPGLTADKYNGLGTHDSAAVPWGVYGRQYRNFPVIDRGLMAWQPAGASFLYNSKEPQFSDPFYTDNKDFLRNHLQTRNGAS